ncbi:WhiB family transcriptional regulator [Bifidobacterium sp. SO1]|uniref:WhiB family transcriptional regulator n=1 Tax=Bifidobacterium sp. SO1 TaxID=2809029 RepID=UPI001BDC8469|nr:WhiB family transcriptional regulator [Bifidobacterium sp. SO1]MBT1162860.1 WhiB family transcriptional regulator [Bifidobacterium sp. SO1]
MTGIPHNAHWRDKAACAREDPELFFPTGGLYQPDRVAKAKKICTSCPVVDECLSYAMDHNELFGIWGGLTEKQRVDLKRRAMHERRRRMYGDGSYRVDPGWKGRRG